MERGKNQAAFLDCLAERTKKSSNARELLTSRSYAHHLLAPRHFLLPWDKVMVRKVVWSPNYPSFDDHLPGAEEDVLGSIRETTEHVKEARAVRPPLETHDDYKLAESKMRRALDRLKRAAVKVIDVPDGMRVSTDGVVKAVRTLLMDITTTMEALLSAVSTARDLVTHSYWFRLQGQESASEDYASLLDLLFVLARTTLAPNNPVLTDAAYDLLLRAAHILGFQLTNDYEYSHTISSPSSITEEAFANFVRCLSGAFHTLGGTLYQAGKYGSAIRFLRSGCPLGTVALRLRRSCDLGKLSSAQDQSKTPGSKEAEGWGQLHDQLSRRWELLGVSCSKIGDRKVSQSLTSFSNTVPSLLSPTGGLRSFH